MSTRTVRNLIKRGELPPPIRIGRKQFWLRSKFVGWLENGGAAPIPRRSVVTPSKPDVLRKGSKPPGLTALAGDHQWLERRRVRPPFREDFTKALVSILK